MGRLLTVFALLALASEPAGAQGTISLYGDTGGGLYRAIEVSSSPFDIVVLMKSDTQSSGAEFVMTELIVEFPSVFKLATTKVNDTTLDLGDNALGEYMIDFGGCIEAGELEIVRVQYLDLGWAIPEDTVLYLRGFKPGDTQPSRFEGQTGYVDCTGTEHALQLEPWGGPCDPVVASWIESSDGAIALNVLVLYSYVLSPHQRPELLRAEDPLRIPRASTI